jgi:hypothetical protein
MRFDRSFLLTVLASALVACGPQTASTGQLTIGALSGALTSRADIAKVTITLTQTTTLAVIQGTMTNSQSDNMGRWLIFFDRIPVGTYSLSSQALNGSGVVLFETPSPLPTADVTSHGTTNVTLLLQEKTPPNPFANSAPYITMLAVSQQQIDPQATITLSSIAGDPDTGDTLTYAWSSSAGGVFSASGAPQTTWTPASAGDAVITFTVSDGHGAQVSASLTINVSSAASRGAIATVVDLNDFPEVKSLTSTDAQVGVNGLIPLSALAIDKDSDPLTFAWSADCAGSFSKVDGTSTSGAQGTTNTTTFTPTSSGNCKLTVSVSDGRGGFNTGSLSVKVGASTIAEGPQFSLTPVGATELDPGGSVEIKAVANDSQSHASWTYSWSDGLTGALAGAFSGSDRADQTYTPAACNALGSGDHSITISVTATDTSTTASNGATLGLVLRCPAAP